MNTKHIVSLLLAGAMILCGGISSAQAKAQYVLRAGNSGTPGSEMELPYLVFKDYVEKASNGAIEVKIFANEILGNGRVMGESAQRGTLDIAQVASAVMPSLWKGSAAAGLPFVVDPEKIDKFRKGLFEGELRAYLNEQMEKIGLKLLWCTDTPIRSFACTKPVPNLASLKGLKMRIPNSPTEIASAKAMGIIPSTLPFGETYTGLQQGTVDGELLAIGSYPPFRRDEVEKHIIMTNHSYNFEFEVMNKKRFDSLPPDIQKILLDGGKRAQEALPPFLADYQQKGEEYCKAHGVNIYYLSDADKAELRRLAEGVWKEMEGEYDPKLLQLMLDAQK